MILKSIIKITWLFSAIYIICNTAYTQEAIYETEVVESQKNQIRRRHNDAERSGQVISEKISNAKKAEQVKDFHEAIEEFFALASSLEANGDYGNAAKCYDKILALTRDPKIRDYIKKKNHELKQLSIKQRSLAAKKIKESTKKLEKKKIDHTREEKIANKKKAEIERIDRERKKDLERIERKRRREIENIIGKERLAEIEKTKPIPSVPSLPKPGISKEITEPQIIREEPGAAPAALEAITKEILQKKDEEKIIEGKIEKAKSLVVEGDKMYQQRKYDEAFELYRQAMDALK